MNFPDQPVAMSEQIHTYTELRQQIHGDLRIQHPNGSSQMANPPCVILTRRASWNCSTSTLFSQENPNAGPRSTPDEEKPNTIFDQQRLDVGAHRMDVLIPTK